MDGGRDNGFDMDEMMGFGDPATEDGGNEPAGPPAANYDAPRRQSSASTGSSGSFVGGYAGPSNPNSPIKKQSSVEIAAENGNQRLNSSRSVADVYADQWLHPFPRKHAAVNLKVRRAPKRARAHLAACAPRVRPLRAENVGPAN